MSVFGDNINNKTILEKLLELKSLGELFNSMVGSHYKRGVADNINDILYELGKEGVMVVVVQDFGLIGFNNLSNLINEYSNGTIY